MQKPADIETLCPRGRIPTVNEVLPDIFFVSGLSRVEGVDREIEMFVNTRVLSPELRAQVMEAVKAGRTGSSLDSFLAEEGIAQD